MQRAGRAWGDQGILEVATVGRNNTMEVRMHVAFPGDSKKSQVLAGKFLQAKRELKLLSEGWGPGAELAWSSSVGAGLRFRNYLPHIGRVQV